MMRELLTNLDAGRLSAAIIDTWQRAQEALDVAMLALMVACAAFGVALKAYFSGRKAER